MATTYIDIRLTPGEAEALLEAADIMKANRLALLGPVREQHESALERINDRLVVWRLKRGSRR